MCNLQGKHHIFNIDHNHWLEAYRDAQTLLEYKKICQTHSAWWLSFWLLEYWDPTQMLVIDAMHSSGKLPKAQASPEGVVHYHSIQNSADSFKFVFDWPCTPYNPETVSTDLKILEQQVVLVQPWTQLDNQGTLGSLQFAACTLGLPMILNSLSLKFSMIHIQHACLVCTTGLLTTKSYYIALLQVVDWRLLQPHSSTTFIIPTGTPETLSHIQWVIWCATTASWLKSVPKNYWETNMGSIKADEWCTLSTVHLPIVLITLWSDNSSCTPPPTCP
ncbi:hypothetical protein BT96DRAFT_959772 [Gymnopus androsaceus JB14]|uniref:Uncharacterized protein n=1 Tax=Gymnopus androsaceus JB14 TaxID=1447944 RepID=A0A6A4GZP8_9AGAR|nr:hypothetical protein BT96DRAFT_959772 [Gymnopus androsaceus JB14]